MQIIYQLNEVGPQISLKVTEGQLFIKKIFFCFGNLILSKFGINAIHYIMKFDLKGIEAEGHFFNFMKRFCNFLTILLKIFVNAKIMKMQILN